MDQEKPKKELRKMLHLSSYRISTDEILPTPMFEATIEFKCSLEAAKTLQDCPEYNALIGDAFLEMISRGMQPDIKPDV